MMAGWWFQTLRNILVNWDDAIPNIIMETWKMFQTTANQMESVCEYDNLIRSLYPSMLAAWGFACWWIEHPALPAHGRLHGKSWIQIDGRLMYINVNSPRHETSYFDRA